MKIYVPSLLFVRSGKIMSEFIDTLISYVSTYKPEYYDLLQLHKIYVCGLYCIDK